jgi:hypothetical protein
MTKDNEIGATGSIGLECPGAVGETRHTELLDALIEAHRQVDTLLAMVITRDRTFRPSQSALWPEIVRRAELINKHHGGQRERHLTRSSGNR